MFIAGGEPPLPPAFLGSPYQESGPVDMHTVRKMWALPSAGALLLGLVALTPVPAIAASGTAVISGIRRDTTSTVVPVTGSCLATNERQNTAQLFLRGPGPSTNIVFSGPAIVDLFGNLFGAVTVPTNAAAGSTFTVSAQCTEPGQPAGVESRRIPLPAPGESFMSFDEGTLPGPPSSTTVTSIQTTPQLPPRGTTGTTTGRASPITRQPQFTG